MLLPFTSRKGHDVTSRICCNVTYLQLRELVVVSAFLQESRLVVRRFAPVDQAGPVARLCVLRCRPGLTETTERTKLDAVLVAGSRVLPSVYQTRPVTRLCAA